MDRIIQEVTNPNEFALSGSDSSFEGNCIISEDLGEIRLDFLQISGSLIVGSGTRVRVLNFVEVGGDIQIQEWLSTGGHLNCNGNVTIGKSLYVLGDINVKKNLHAQSINTPSSIEVGHDIIATKSSDLHAIGGITGGFYVSAGNNIKSAGIISSGDGIVAKKGSIYCNSRMTANGHIAAGKDISSEDTIFAGLGMVAGRDVECKDSVHIVKGGIEVSRDLIVDSSAHALSIDVGRDASFITGVYVTIDINVGRALTTAREVFAGGSIDAETITTENGLVCGMRFGEAGKPSLSCIEVESQVWDLALEKKSCPD